MSKKCQYEACQLETDNIFVKLPTVILLLTPNITQATMLKSRMHIIQKENDEKTPKEPMEVTVVTDKNTELGGEDQSDYNDYAALVIPTYPVRQLSRSEISQRLSLLGKNAEGDGYTYLKANLTGLQLTDIKAITSFKHLQFLDVSNNHLDTRALKAISKLPSLVLLQADNNELNSAILPKMKYLQVIIMNNNNIGTVQNVYQPELSTLEVGNNKIHKIELSDQMSTIRCLDFRHNLLKDISDLRFPNLDSLYLAGNKITSLDGVENLVNLRILHVRENPIKLLNGFTEANKKIEYLNLRRCMVSTYVQVKKLMVLTGLQTLIMRGCPYMGGKGEDATGAEEEDSMYRIEILVSLPWLKRINKNIVSPEERIEAKELMMQWMEEGKVDEEELEEGTTGEFTEDY